MKNLRKILIAGLSVILLSAGCGKQEGLFTITGKITHAEGKTIYLEELLVAATKPVDSVKISKTGEFSFKGKTTMPTYYLLKLSGQKFITLLLDSLEQVVVEADAANFERSYKVEGSPGSLQVKTLSDRLLTTRKKLDSLQSMMNLNTRNPDFPTMKANWEAEIDSIKKRQTEFSTQFVMGNAFSMSSVLALYQKFDDNEYVIKELHPMRVAASALHAVYPNSGHVKALYQNTLQMIKEEQSFRMQQFIREQGDNSPDIVLPDVNGKEVALSSLRGKTVLLQFWSAVDRNSRIQNEVLVEAYQKYKSKGFEIYQVSVDENRIEWVDAIDQDGLTWVNVGDMEGSYLALLHYNVQSIPFNYLMNKEGIIIAKDLSGPALDKALAGLLN